MKSIIRSGVIAAILLNFIGALNTTQARDDTVSASPESRALVKEVLKDHPELSYRADKSKTASKLAGKPALKGVTSEGRVIVRLRAGANPQQVTSQLQTAVNDLKLLRRFALAENLSQSAPGPRWILVVESKNISTANLINVLKNNSAVEIAEPDYLVHAVSTFPNDSRFNDLWGMNNTGQFGRTVDADIDAPEAWDRITGNGSVIVGSIDTGVDYNHPDLVANMWRNLPELNGSNGVDDDGNGYIDDIYGIDVVNLDSDPIDDHSHGTHTSGTLGGVGNNAEGVAGVNWNVKIAACKFLSSYGDGFTSGAIECVNYFTGLKQQGENIVATNNSWGGGGFEQTLKDAIDASGTAGTLFVAAAGNNANDNDSNPSYPASYTSSNIIAVAATTDTDVLASFSNYGATSVDLAAPGQHVLSSVLSVAGCNFAPESASLFYDGFESGFGAWSLLGLDTNNPFYNNPSYWWVQDSVNHYTGGYSASDSVGNYSNNTLTSAIAAPDLSGAPFGPLCGGLWLKGQAETNYDYLTVYISKDNGANWTSVKSTTGQYANWTKLTFQIPNAYKNSSFRIALVRTNDYIINFDGYYVDDVGIGRGTPTLIAQYDFYSGTSMATPHVAGAVALAAMAFPGESLAARKTRILNSVDVLGSLSGKVATNGRLNLAKVVAGGTDNLLRWPDMNGDANSDLVWRNYSNGANSAWFMNGTGLAGSAGIPAVSDLNWRIVGIPDMNYDGQPDILWRNYSSGANSVWYMNGASIVGSAGITNVADLNWRIVGTPDMNGDGKPDLLWRNYSSGATSVWYMNGASMVGSAGIATVADLNWRIVGTPDMNGDGKPDLLWRNFSNGQNSVWYMNGPNMIGSAVMLIVPDLNRHIVATPDVNKDGKPDLVWRNYSNGANAVWYMNGVSLIGTASLPTATPVSWVIENNGDF